MQVKRGDFIRIEYVTRIKETGETFDTTSEEEAKKGNIFRENAIYEPLLVVVGEGWVLQGLDDSLVGLEVDKETTIEIPPEQGFGLRDPSKISLIPLRRLRRQKIEVYPGVQIEINGKLAVVRSVGAGRVQVDFNPPLAGKTLVYQLTVKVMIKDVRGKAIALIHRRIPTVNVDKFKIIIRGKRASINIPEEAFILEGIQTAKRGISTDLFKFLPNIEKIVFSESFMKNSAHSPSQV